MTFSIIVVCLNAGERLRETIESIRNQTERDYEIIVKDGGSTDEVTKAYLDEYEKLCDMEESAAEEIRASGSAASKSEKETATAEEHDIRTAQESPPGARLRLYRSKDTGIYDGMNQAVQYVRGDYALFMNCGDSFYDEHVLARVKEQMGRRGRDEGKSTAQQAKRMLLGGCIYYGNIFERQTGTLVQSNPVIDDFACYRNIPCHQACFYAAGLLRRKPFDTSYAVRADYEHFLWCYYEGHAEMIYMPVTVALYEGGGFSETRENEKKSRREHREIVNKYMPRDRVRKYRLIMIVTLAPLRTWIARNPATAGLYQSLKKGLYRR